MIRGINIAINAAHPELPLVEATTFVGSPSSVFVRGVPKSCGNWRITAVSVVVTYPDNTTTTRVAMESAQGVWVATIPGTATSGRTIGGFRILADGEDENGAAVTGYVLGFADFAVFSMLPVPAPGETFYLLRYFDAQPATPKKGDAAIIGGVLKYYNGAAWAPFADLSNYYTKGETDAAIERVAAYYITADAQGHAFATYAALVSASTYYSGGVARVPTRNDYAVVLADETHGGAEYRYIYAIADGATSGQWEAQYPIETNDYTALSNKPSINGNTLAGNKTGAQLGLANATDLTPLQLAALYPEGDVKSASEWATPWNGSTGIKYELDATTHTAAILTFSKTSNTANDNSHLTGRVVIPPFIESNGERYTVASIKDHSGGGLPTYDLTEVVAPTTLETIGRFAFYFCMGLKRAYFPRASQLKYNAFQDCRALEYISIPNVSNVPTQCFINDSSLKGLVIPNAESILLGGLSGCAALEVVNFGSVARSAVPTFYNNSFYNVPETCKIIIPDSQYTAWTTASGWSGLVTAGYEFIKHSDWEAPHRYELATKEDKANKTTSLSAQSTDTQYPSAKCVWDALQNVSGQLTILEYGDAEAWPKFLNAIANNKLVFCKVPDGSNPPILARFSTLNYYNPAASEVEFLYIRTRSHDYTHQTDERYVYKLTSDGTWTSSNQYIGWNIKAGQGMTYSIQGQNCTIGLDTTGVAGNELPASPTQAEVAQAVKTLWQKFGGAVATALAAITIPFATLAVDVTPDTAWWDIPPTNKIGAVMDAVVHTNNYYTKSQMDASLSSVSNDCASTRAIVMTWEQFLDGSNVVISITNYISGAYSLDAAKLRILELKDGVYHETYNSRDEILLHINDFKTNDFANATNQVIGAVNAAIDGKADKAWGKYSSDGQDLQDISISNTVYMTAPNTVFAGGLGYERVAVGQGAVCVLTTRGAPVWTQGDEGTFKFQDDGGTNYFGFAKTDSYTVGAGTDGISVDGGIVTLRYDITMSGVPCVWYKSELSPNTPWEQLNLPDGSAVSGASYAVTWDNSPPVGSEVCYINCGNSPSGFFKATIEVPGDVKFVTNMRADMSGGIVCTNTATHVNGIVKPTFNGSTVSWTWSAQ